MACVDAMGDDLRNLLAELYEWGPEYDAHRRHADTLRIVRELGVGRRR
jgi:hypothetical protein